jgi:molybdenum cofactor biosynthesis protein B
MFPHAPGSRYTRAMPIDETREFLPVRISIMTVSDTRTRADDTSGDVLEARIREAGHKLVDRCIVSDEMREIAAQLKRWIASHETDVVISTGGTGLTGRDVTPEAFRSVFEKEIDGFSVLFHMVSAQKVGTSTIQSRACAGVANGTYLFALPGSPGAVKDGWDGILRDQLDSRHRPCNFVDIMPRLKEHLRAG